MIGTAWVGATGAAVTLTWFGVGSVLRGTVYDPPRALPVTGPPADHADAGPDVSSTQRPPVPGEDPGGDDAGGGAGSRPPEPPPDDEDGAEETAGPGDAPGVTPDGDADGPTDPATRAPESEGAGSGLGSVETVATDGGRVAFDMGPESAELVSATPAPGWEMQVWAEDTYIRVSFSGEGRTVSVFCVFNGHPPYLDRHEE